MSEVLKMFWELNRHSVEADGIRIPHAVYSVRGALTAEAMALFGEDGPLLTWKEIGRVLVTQRPDELVFGLDRFSLEGQGVATKDLLSVHHWDGRAWRFGVIPYQHKPPIFEPIDWHNEFWVQALRDEMTRMWSAITAAPHRQPHPAMILPLPFDRLNEAPVVAERRAV